VAGVEHLSLAADGDLLLRTAAGVVRQHRPVIYQLVHGARRPIGGGYLLAGRAVGFQVGAYDRRAALGIDPELVCPTYVGNKSDNPATASRWMAGATSTSPATPTPEISPRAPPCSLRWPVGMMPS
jgi:hypothetical protein